MATAHEVAIELRKLADSLDREPDAEVPQAWVSFYAYEKKQFLNAARLNLRPAVKKIQDEGRNYARLQVKYESLAMDCTASVPQSLTCTLVEPAKPAVYRCDPILSADEELEVA